MDCDQDDNKDLQAAQRISFSCCCDFQLISPLRYPSSPSSSSQTLFLDHHHHHFDIQCEEGDHDNDRDDDDDDDNESYIEIAIEDRRPSPTPLSTGGSGGQDNNNNKSVNDDEDLEFRISFSSSCLFPEFQGFLPNCDSARLPPTSRDHDPHEEEHKHDEHNSHDGGDKPPSNLLDVIPTSSNDDILNLSYNKSPSSISSSSSSSSSSTTSSPIALSAIGPLQQASADDELSCDRQRDPPRKIEKDDFGHHHQQQQINKLGLSCLRPYSSSSEKEDDNMINGHSGRYLDRQVPQYLGFQTAPPPIRNWKLLRSRKVTKVKTAINGGIMKLFIKFRSIKIRSVLSSYMNKPTREEFNHQCSSLQSNTTSSLYEEINYYDDDYDDFADHHKKLMMPHNNNNKKKTFNINRCSSVQIPNSHYVHSSFGFGFGCGISSIVVNDHRHDHQKTRVPVVVENDDHQEMKLDPILTNNANLIGGDIIGDSLGKVMKKQMSISSQSCPSSIKSSPIHAAGSSSTTNNAPGATRSTKKNTDNNFNKIYTIQENSVEGAIAYCKRSFCQISSDHHFHFHHQPSLS